MKWISFSAIVFLFSCAGSKNLIKDADAFVITLQQGMVQVDEKGNEVSKQPGSMILVFMQSPSNQLKFDSAWIDNKAYAVLQQQLTQPFEIGTDVATGENIIITPNEGSFLYQVQITPSQSQGEEQAGSIRVRANYRNKTIYKNVAPIRSVKTPDAQ